MIEQSVQQVRCPSCSGSQPVTSRVRGEGWYRCSFCGTANSLPWSEMEAQDGPTSAIVLLRRGRLLHFVIPAGTLFFKFEAAFLAFILASVAALTVGVAQLHALGPLSIFLVVEVALCGIYWGLRRHLSQQHLEIDGPDLTWYRSVRGRKRGFEERSIDQGLPVEGSDASSRRYRVRLFPDEKPLDLLCSGRREGKWLEAHLAAATSDEPSTHWCPGCGAPLDRSAEQRGRGYVNCDHCRTGFVADDAGLVWDALVLPKLADRPRRPGRRVVDAPGGWTVRTRPAPLVTTWAAGMLMAAVLLAGLGAAMTWMALALTPPAGLRVYMLLSGPGLLVMAAAVVRIAVSVVAARLELRMDEGSFRFEKRVGTWMAAPPTLVPQQPGEVVERMQGAIPIRYLVQVEFEREALGQTLMILRSPTRELKVRWTLDAADDRWLKAELVEALRERLVALGREVC